MISYDEVHNLREKFSNELQLDIRVDNVMESVYIAHDDYDETTGECELTA